MEMLRELLNDKPIRQMLRQLPARLDVQRVARVDCRVEHVARVRALREGELDRVLLVGLLAPAVALVELEDDVRAVVELGDAPVRDGQAGVEDEVDERVDVRFFGEVEAQAGLAAVSCFFEVLDDFAEERKGSEDAYLLSKASRSS